jgi:hypothetical protein
VWRPCVAVVQDQPIAFCDAATVRPDDILAIDRVTQTYLGEVAYLKYKEEHRWYYYLRHQTSNTPVHNVASNREHIISLMRVKFSPVFGFRVGFGNVKKFLCVSHLQLVKSNAATKSTAMGIAFMKACEVSEQRLMSSPVPYTLYTSNFSSSKLITYCHSLL